MSGYLTKKIFDIQNNRVQTVYVTPADADQGSGG